MLMPADHEVFNLMLSPRIRKLSVSPIVPPRPLPLVGLVGTFPAAAAMPFLGLFSLSFAEQLLENRLARSLRNSRPALNWITAGFTTKASFLSACYFNEEQIYVSCFYLTILKKINTACRVEL